MSKKVSKNVLVRILEKVKFMPNGCLEWQGTKNPLGYGVIRVATENRTVLVHRRVMELVLDIKIEKGKQVCHICDNPSCVNPMHLYVGDAMSNVHDMIARGRDRKAKGTKVNTNVLTIEQVKEIRKFKKQGWRNLDLSIKYGVTPNCIRAIVIGRSWKWLIE